MMRGPRSSRPLHLLEVGVRWPPETFLRRKLQGLAARGVRVTVASQLVHDADVSLEGVELVPVPWQGTTRDAARATLRLLVASPRRLVRLLRRVQAAPAPLRRRHGGRTGLLAMYGPLARLRPDVVQFEWNIAAVDHLPLFDVWDCPVVTACRGSDITVYPHVPTLSHYADRLPEVMGKASVVHCVSDSLKREATGFGLDPAKARVIRPAVDCTTFRPVSRNGRRDGDAWRVVSVGWARWEKGHDYALGAIRALADRGVPVRFELFGASAGGGRGDTDERERVLHTVADLSLGDVVRLHEAATPAEVGHRLAGADALLHSSLAEGIPNAVLEAMACGVPVVTTDCGGVSEAVADGVEGFVVAPRDPERLAAALLRLWQDPGLARRMGKAGRARARSSFTPERHIEQFMALYREVAGATARRRIEGRARTADDSAR